MRVLCGGERRAFYGPFAALVSRFAAVPHGPAHWPEQSPVRHRTRARIIPPMPAPKLVVKPVAEPIKVISAMAVPRAMILAAGRGARMRPLTDATPKPLLEVRGKPLIEWHLEALARGGVREVVINTAWHEEQIVAALGDGARWGMAIRYSMEGRDHGGALETAGGIAAALPLLVEHADDAFWLVSGDIFAPDFVFEAQALQRFRDGSAWAHLWLVPNPPYHPQGDFGLDASGHGLADTADPASVGGASWTYANLALCRAALCRPVAPGTRAALAPLLFDAMRQRRITAEVYGGAWENVGTPAQLDALNGGPEVRPGGDLRDARRANPEL